jgi:hypothetical protein
MWLEARIEVVIGEWGSADRYLSTHNCLPPYAERHAKRQRRRCSSADM